MIHSPREPTIRRILQAIDPEEVDAAIGVWLIIHVKECNLVAVDG
ncbi:hypothetical protein J2Z49_000661 [Desulfofundulus luciae]|uniref:Uncharacterized protein n=1 Tax=Desulfofundulus luciae TaxID=74702 RepID=A0ABU0AYM2_9FIRM|nr:hypothetical protein [Desulfofundulus luciae]MDQ0285557.1 hypothetical protein [Desulfofundulus luciae]